MNLTSSSSSSSSSMSTSSPSSSSLSSQLIESTTTATKKNKSKVMVIACTSAVLIFSFILYTSASFVWITDRTSVKHLNLHPNLDVHLNHISSTSDNISFDESEHNPPIPEDIEERVVFVEKDVDQRADSISNNKSSKSSRSNQDIEENGEHGNHGDEQHLHKDAKELKFRLRLRSAFKSDLHSSPSSNNYNNIPTIIMTTTTTTTTNTNMSGRRKLQKTLVQLMSNTYLTSFSFVEWIRVLLLVIGGPLIVGITIALAFSQLFAGEESRRSRGKSSRSRDRKSSNRRRGRDDNDDDDDDDDDDSNGTDDYTIDEEYSTLEMEEKKRAWKSRKEKLLRS